MAEFAAQLGEVRMTIEVKRAETGKIETFNLIGKVMADEKESDHGTDAFDHSA